MTKFYLPIIRGLFVLVLVAALAACGSPKQESAPPRDGSPPPAIEEAAPPVVAEEAVPPPLPEAIPDVGEYGGSMETGAEPEAEAEEPAPPPPPLAMPAPAPLPQPEAAAPELEQAEAEAARAIMEERMSEESGGLERAYKLAPLEAEETMAAGAEPVSVVAAPEPVGAEPEPAVSSVQRYPTMESPDEVAEDKEFALMVSLTEELITPEVKIKAGETDGQGRLNLSLPESADDWKIEVILSAPAFTFTKGANASSMLLPKEGDSTPALFHLKPKPGGTGKHGETIYATFWYEGAFLAKVSRELQVVGKDAPASAGLRSAEPSAVSPSLGAPPAPVVPAGQPVIASAPQAAVVDAEYEQPDLTIYVLENLDPSKPYDSEIIIASPYLQPTLFAYQKPAGLDEWLQFNYAKFVQEILNRHKLVAEGATPAALESARLKTTALLRGFGAELYQRFAPAPFKDAFWRLKERLGPDFDTIQIYSNNPVIPWELMRPASPDGSAEVEFLGREFTIGRWHVTHGSAQLDRAPQSVDVSELIVVAPGYREGQALSGQTTELAALEKVTGFRVLPGTMEALEPMFRSFPRGIIHFAGHGSARPTSQGPYEYVITLEDGELDLTTLRGMTGPVRTENHPFFFFNACEVGQARRVADFVSGWAPAVLEAGASGFIGALWPVEDRAAAEFSEYFYGELEQALKQGPVYPAELLKKTRDLFLREGNPTFLAFIYYGDPNLRMVRP